MSCCALVLMCAGLVVLVFLCEATCSACCVMSLPQSLSLLCMLPCVSLSSLHVVSCRYHRAQERRDKQKTRLSCAYLLRCHYLYFCTSIASKLSATQHGFHSLGMLPVFPCFLIFFLTSATAYVGCGGTRMWMRACRLSFARSCGRRLWADTGFFFWSFSFQCFFFSSFLSCARLFTATRTTSLIRKRKENAHTGGLATRWQRTRLCKYV